MQRRYFSALALSILIAGCSSPMGRFHHSKGELSRRLDPDYKAPEAYEECKYMPYQDPITGKLTCRTPPMERVIGRIVEEYVTHKYEEGDTIYDVWKWGNDVADWIDENTRFNLGGMRGHITIDSDNRAGITLEADF